MSLPDGLQQDIIMPGRPSLLQDLSEQLIANEIPGVKGGFTESPKRLVGQI